MASDVVPHATLVPGAPPNPPAELGEDVLIGGSAEDQQALRDLHHRFLAANDVLDYSLLDPLWSTGPEHWYFNLNGYNFYGVEDWHHIWDFYRPRFALVAPYSPGRLQIRVDGDMGFVAAEYIGRTKRWTGADAATSAVETHSKQFAEDLAHYRSTQVCQRTAEGWKVVHAHFSIQELGARPDQTGAEAGR
jgi:ketosteroid isomerase-like protein